MAASTTQRPLALPSSPGPKPAPVKTPQGATKLARMYLDDRGIPQQALIPGGVPVDENDRRTGHELCQCPHMSPVNGGGKERCPAREWLLPDDPKPFCARHGKQLEPQKTGPSPAALVFKAAWALHGRSAAPWLIPAVGAVTDAALHAAHIGSVEAGVAAPLLAGGAYLVSKRTLTARAVKRGRLEQGQRTGRRYLAVQQAARRHAARGLEAGLWVAALAGTDIFHTPGLVVAGLGMVRWAFVSRDWWNNADERRRRGATADLPHVDAAAAALPAVAEPDPVQLNAETTWKTRIGCPGGPLAGTKLVDFTRLPNVEAGPRNRTLLPNWSAKVVAVEEGSINMREMRPALRGRIAAAFKCTYADVSFAADEDDLSVAYVRVQPDNPLAQVRMWTGPTATDWNRGVSTIGRFDDGRPMLYQWWDEGGACHDLLGGTTGSGKSEAVAQLILTSLHSEGLVLDWVGDPQGGQSYGALKDRVDWFARDRGEIKLMLLAAVKEMYRRNDILSAGYTKTWRPTVDMPLLVITLDEFQDYITDVDINELCLKLAGQARKCGIKLRPLTQITAAYNMGGNTYIKEMVKSGQTFTFRSETEVAGRSAADGDSPIDPTALPRKWGPNTCASGKKTAGLVFLQGVHGRDIYGRTDFTGDDMMVWLVKDGESTITPGTFSVAAQKRSGVLWADRHERARRLLDAGRDDADLLANGRALELIEQASTAAERNAPLRTPQPGEAKAQDSARDKVLAACRKVADEHGIADKKRVVAEVAGEVAETTVTSCLTKLISDDELRRVRNGLYEVPGLAEARQAGLEAS